MRAGISLKEFWSLTPKEISWIIQAENFKLEDQYKLAIYTAWHVAAFDRQKRLPKLEKFLRPNKKKGWSEKEIMNAMRTMKKGPDHG